LLNTQIAGKSQLSLRLVIEVYGLRESQIDNAKYTWRRSLLGGKSSARFETLGGASLVEKGKMVCSVWVQLKEDGQD